MSVHMYRLTKNGRKVAGKVTMSNRNKFLDYLYRNKTATDEEMGNYLGMSAVAVRMALRRMPRLVEDMTSGEGGF